MNFSYCNPYFTYPYTNSTIFSYYNQQQLNYFYYQEQLPQMVSQQVNNSLKEDIKSTQVKDENFQQLKMNSLPSEIQIKKETISQLSDNCKKVKITKITGNTPVKYLYKNTESNISNQIFSYLLHPSKSQTLLTSILQKIDQYNPDKIFVFYHYMKIIKKRTKKYLNKKSLLALCNMNDNHPSFKQISKNTKKLSILSREDFSKVIRIMIKIYLENQCISNLLTSKKIDNETRMSHLGRRRIIKQFLELHLSNNC